MAAVRMTLDEAKAASKIDWTKVNATTEEDIRRHMVEDGEDPDAPLPPSRMVFPPDVVRKRLGLSQQEFATLINVPIGTLRNWEQDRFPPEAAARALMTILALEPEAAIRALARHAAAPDVEAESTWTK